MRLVRLFAVVLVLIGAGVGYLVLAPFGPDREVFVEVPPHTGTLNAAAALADAGIVRSRWVLVGLREADGGTLKAGEYRFDHPLSALEVYRRLRHGDVYTIGLVIPEGFNLFDIADAVQQVGLGTRAEFLAAAAQDVRLVRPWSPHATSVEGFLFPDTYRFGRHAGAHAILNAMTRRFGQVALRTGLAGPEIERTVTLASLVEREVHKDRERPLVAGVFENRLRLGMPLQTDPSVVYASLLRGTWNGVIHQSELRSDSAYNTYTHKGLPPGPICNPGVASLRAALHPESTDYLYFVANPDGSTHFARDLAEHNVNVATYRRQQAGQP